MKSILQLYLKGNVYNKYIKPAAIWKATKVMKTKLEMKKTMFVITLRDRMR